MRLFLVLGLALFCSAPHAGLYSDDMAKCLVASTSQADKTNLVRWIFANAALHPDVSDISTVSAASRDQMNRTVATLVERLLTETCRKQSQEAVRYEGPIAIQLSFQILGQVAMQELMRDQAVSAGFEAFAKYIDRTKIEALGKR
jgi:hypothetical protein